MPVHVVSDKTAGLRLDQFLHRELPEHSRAFLQKLIEQGDVQVNGKPSKASHTVRVGDKIGIEIPPPRPLEALPEEIPLDVLFEDRDLVVVNKPAGLVVHHGDFPGVVVIGAGAVVSRDITVAGTYAGNPARRLASGK